MWSKNKVETMPEQEDDIINLVRIPSVDEHQQERHARAILESSPSTISFEPANVPRNVIDDLSDIYTHRTHKRCIDISYLTLLSMTLAVVFWVSYWLTYNRCENLKPPQPNSFLCDLVIIFETLTFITLSLSPLLFILMIYFWINYSCVNPFDPIRENYVGIKLETNHWTQQLDYYYTKKQNCSCFNICRRKQRKELNDRGYGYMILSPYGIAIDELILFSHKTKLIDEGILLHKEKILKFILKKTWKRFWKTEISICLPDELINRHIMDDLMQRLNIKINMDTSFPPCF